MQITSRHGRRRVFLASFALVAPLMIGLAPSVRAQEPAPPTAPAAPEEKLVTLDVRDARLEQAVMALTGGGSGLNNIVIENAKDKNFGLVTVRLVDQPLRRVLDAIAKSAGAVLGYEDGIYYFRHNNGDRPVQTPAAPVVKAPETAPSVSAAVTAPAKPHANRQWTKVKLTFMLPSVFSRILEDPTFMQIYEATTPPVEPPLKMTVIPNNGVPVQQAVGNVPIATPPQSGVAGSAGGRSGESPDAAGQRGGFGGQGAGFGGQGAGFGGGPGGLGGPGGGGPGAGGPGGAGQGAPTLRPPGITNIISHDADNALLVEYDDVEDLNRLREIIRLLDVAPKQVLVKAEFVSVGISDADSFGIDWRFQPSGNLDVAIPPETGTTPTITMAWATGNAVANLRASLIRTTSNIIQAPLISTINNRLAFINFSDTVTITQTVNTVTQAGIVSGTQQVPITSFNGLAVLPHINGDNTITMFLQPSLSTIDVEGSGFRATTQTLTTTRIIKSGETMVLGGFITRQEALQIRKVPLLSDLPIIGNLFTQRTRASTGAEVLVFITPVIIEDYVQGTLGPTGGPGAPSPTP